MKTRARTLATPHTAVIWKGMESISTRHEPPQITSLQHFHDIVAVLASLPQCHSGGVRMLSFGVRMGEGPGGGGGLRGWGWGGCMGISCRY